MLLVGLLFIDTMNFNFIVQKKEIYTLNETEKTNYPKNWKYTFLFYHISQYRIYMKHNKQILRETAEN